MTGIDVRESLARLSRANDQGIKAEQALLTAAAAQPPAWLVKVMSLSSYNAYNVQLMSISQAGVNPSPISDKQIVVYNIAESFMATGSVGAGTLAVMWRVGSSNVIYVQP